jgi:endonuclease-3 related protein
VTPPGGAVPVYTPGRLLPPGEREAFEICAGAILTQNTSWTNVEKALKELNREGLLSPEKLARCPLPRLERAVKSSGYFRQKARRLKEFSSRLLEDHPEGIGAWFSSANAKELRAELLSYTGVGPETADCMVLYAAGKPSFVIDAYTRRIGERVGLAWGLSYNGWKSLFEGEMPPDVKVYNEYHALLVKLGKDFCRKTKPLCARCPLDLVCAKRIYEPGKNRRPAGRRRIRQGPGRH